ncbi:class F sortase [Rhizohabitans arisaemae]|uniref:class F sortase n=1 Tax=Rhizohabitans arisaemae TaxID=2720610 RepID=UPI0024B2350E|nr:class F sortase [Rhizohabitans arisaemae]
MLIALAVILGIGAFGVPQAAAGQAAGPTGAPQLSAAVQADDPDDDDDDDDGGDDDDDRRVPRGGVETGAGGTWNGQVADPVRLRVPSIGLTTRVIPLKLDVGGKLVAPKRYDLAGWNRKGPEPGERGASVIAGHVDSKTGPAVFYRLRQLRPGDKIHVDRADGTTVTFKVSKLARYAKNRVPDGTVYGPTKTPQLRLITCGGVFDKRKRSYRDNIVVFAR